MRREHPEGVGCRGAAAAHGAEDLARNEILGTPSGEISALVELLQSSTGVALATLAVLDEGRFHFLVCAGSDPFVTEHEDAVV